MSDSLQSLEQVPLGAIAEVITGGTPDRRREEYWGGSIPWVTTTEIDFGRIRYATEYISKEGLKRSAAKVLPVNTILMAMYGQGATRGKVAILGIEAATNQACAAIRPKDTRTDTSFLFQVLAHKYTEIRRLGHGGNQQNLNTQLIRSIKIPLFQPKEQSAIVRIGETWDAAIDKTEQLIVLQRKLRNRTHPTRDDTARKRYRIGPLSHANDSCRA